MPREAEGFLGKTAWRQVEGFAVGDLSVVEKIRVRIVCTGIGPERAATAARWLGPQVRTLLVVGVSGGLNPCLRPGHLIAARGVLEQAAGPEQAISSTRQVDWAERVVQGCHQKGLRADAGVLVSAARPVLGVAAKQALFRRSGALAVDMETAAAARIAAQMRLPFGALRAICDPAWRPVPRQLFDCLEGDGRVRWQPLIMGLLRRPALGLRLLKSQQDFNSALGALKKAWPLCLQVF